MKNRRVGVMKYRRVRGGGSQGGRRGGRGALQRMGGCPTTIDRSQLQQGEAAPGERRGVPGALEQPQAGTMATQGPARRPAETRGKPRERPGDRPGEPGEQEQPGAAHVMLRATVEVAQAEGPRLWIIMTG